RGTGRGRWRRCWTRLGARSFANAHFSSLSCESDRSNRLEQRVPRLARDGGSVCVLASAPCDVDRSGASTSCGLTVTLLHPLQFIATTSGFSALQARREPRPSPSPSPRNR